MKFTMKWLQRVEVAAIVVALVGLAIIGASYYIANYLFNALNTTPLV